MTLDEQYQKAIDDQRTYLLKIQDEFNASCDSAKTKAQEKLKTIQPEDKEAREEVLKEQKEALEEALRVLKNEVDHSTRMTMQKLELIITEKEKTIISDLEKQMAAL